MIHGIYIKTKPKSKWHLVSICTSPEMANHDVNLILKRAELEGNNKIETAIQVYESGFYIPELLAKVKDYKPLYN